MQKEIHSTAEKFAKTSLKPFMTEWDKNETFPEDVLREAASLGFASIYCKYNFS